MRGHAAPPHPGIYQVPLPPGVPFATYEFDGDKVDVVNGMASLVKV